MPMHAACRAPPPVIPRTRQRSCVTQAAKAASLSRRRRRGGGVMPSRQTSLPFLAGGSTHPLLTPINSGRCTCTARSRNRHLTDALWNEQGHDLWEGGCKIRKMHRKKKGSKIGRPSHAQYGEGHGKPSPASRCHQPHQVPHHLRRAR